MRRSVRLPSGETVPALGQGTWCIGDQPGARAGEIAALRLGIDLGMTLIDTAEMYGDGRSEQLIAEAIEGRRQDVFLVSKAYPQNAGRQSLPLACERSLRRLRTDRLDLYLLHWRGGTPLAATVEAFERLVAAGKIRHWGVSNFDTGDMRALLALERGGACATNQILYNLTRRKPEFDLIPSLRQRSIPVMAYSPVEQGRLPSGGPLAEVARRKGASTFQVALAWLLRREGTIVIPKAGSPAHVRDNRAAADLVLDEEDLATLDRAFPPPKTKAPLDML